MDLYVSRSAYKQLLKIPFRIRIKIETSIEQLSEDPYPPNSKKLAGRNGWRFRTGDYRTIYQIDKLKNRIIILNVAHRKDAYKGM